MKKLYFLTLCAAYYSAHCMEKQLSPIQIEFTNTLIQKIVDVRLEKSSDAFAHKAHNEISCFFSSPYTLYGPKQLSARLNIPHDTYKRAYKKTVKLFSDAQMHAVFKDRRF